MASSSADKFFSMLGISRTLSERPVGDPPPAPETPDLSSMDLSEIASLIRRDWGGKVNYAAKPYLSAMFSLSTVNDNYGWDSGREIVLRFLGNARSWRGPMAKAVKAELNRRLKGR